ncbi:MAG TPA: hypothetical protein P5121_21995, partial [Caldilineaceae bacterium]|nr:hypothetical protein [Caldilineaceae bacterium]
MPHRPSAQQTTSGHTAAASRADRIATALALSSKSGRIGLALITVALALIVIPFVWDGLTRQDDP